MDVRRLLVYSPQETFLGEIAPGNVLKRVRTEVVNGEHSLTLTCGAVLSKGQRVLSCDHTGRWREWVVNGEDKEHRSGNVRFGTYYLVWSLQYDLALTHVYKMPGVQSPVAAGVALAAALDGTSRWGVGTVTRTATGGASMWDKSGWQALAILVSVWGGEIDANIAVGSTGVVSRTVCLYNKMGNQTPTRRFDWSRDLSSVKRKVVDGPWPCRIIPRGKGEATEGGGHGRKITIESVNGGVEWLQNDAAAELVKVPDGRGGYEYPVVIVENGDIEDPQELKDWALSVIYDYTEPQVTYTAGLVQLDQAGTGPKGVSLGDAIHVVDRGFCDGGLRIHARVMKLVTNELDDSDITATMGGVAATLSGTISNFDKVKRAVEDMCGGTLSTADYLAKLIGRINAEINATGGYTYLVPGIGAVTYDTAVSDETVGSEASQVTEMRGGTLRFANSRTSGGDWNWTNVITADGYLGLAATIARLTAGSIGSPSGNYWNLDTGEFRMAAASTKVGNQTLAQYIGDNLGLTQTEVFNLLTNNGALQGLYMSGGQLYMNATYIKTGALNADLITTGSLNANLIKTGYIGDASGKSYWDLSNGTIVIVNSNKNFNNRNEQFKFGSITFTDSSGWLNTRTGQQTATGVMVGDTADSNVAGRSRIYMIPNLPATSSDSTATTEAVIIARDALKIMSEYDGSTTRGCISMNSGYVEINQVYGSTVSPGILIGSAGTYINAKRSDYTLNNGNTATSITSSAYFGTDIYFYDIVHLDSGFSCPANASVGVNDASKYKTFNVYGSATIWSGLSVYGSKSRVVNTDDYSDRLLYCYETPAPLFGDVGSGVIDEDGTCVVSIDDVFSECARTDMAYQVFLQKCGPGDLWVAEKASTHFVVNGTPGLAFDWEVKAHQSGFEMERLDDLAVRDESDAMGMEDTSLEDVYKLPSSVELERAYDEELSYIDEIESLYEEAA